MRNKLGYILWGAFFILIGIATAGNAFELWDFTLFFDGWWTLFIIVPCLISIFQSGFAFINSLGLIVGVLFLLSAQNIIAPNVAKNLVVPVILLGIGIMIIWKYAFNRSYVKIKSARPDSIPDYTAIFGGQELGFSGERFYGASLTAIFGGIDLYLKDSVISEDVRILSLIHIFATTRLR